MLQLTKVLLTERGDGKAGGAWSFDPFRGAVITLLGGGGGGIVGGRQREEEV